MTIGMPTFKKPAPQTSKVTTWPAPTGGVDVRQPAGAMLPENCLYTYNLLPAEWGMLLRDGFREYALDAETAPAAGDGVRSIFAFDGVQTSAIDDRLFSVTKEGIWDTTEYDTPPVQKVVFVETSIDAGRGVFSHYIDQGGEEFLWYADETNGLWEYTQSTDLWARPTGITGPDVEAISFVVVHKQRVWMIERDSTIGWYLPVASKSGQATEFYFGSKFPHGGKLSGLYNWSVDGGAGVDDYLIAVSSSGDVVPYQGSDPSVATTWNVVGSYFIGKTPKGRRFVSEYGGNIYMLSSYGILAMSDLLRGVDAKDVAQQSLSFKIARELRVKLLQTGDQYGWELQFIPSSGMLIVLSPAVVGQERIQFVMNLTTQAWGYWRGVPMDCLTDWRGKIYFGRDDNSVQLMDVTRDNVKITQVGDYNGDPVKYSMLTSFQRYNADGRFKTCHYIRPDFWGTQKPEFTAKPLYDYEIAEITAVSTPPLPEGDVWDVGLWDAAIWGGGSGVSQNKLFGGGGIGRAFAIAIRGESSAGLRFISFDVLWQDAGPT